MASTESAVHNMSYAQAFRLGLITQLSNPKIAIVLASIFTALLPKEIPTYFYSVVLPICVSLLTQVGIR